MSEKSATAVKTEAKPSLNVDKSGLLQRKCDCGNAAGLMGECSECQQKKLTVQRREKDGGEVPAIVHELFPFQTKLTVGKPGDIYEQEADRIAAQVMTMPAVQPINRQSDKEEENREIQRKPLAERITPLVQREAMTGNENPPQVTNSLESRLNSSQGSPLSDNVRLFMEPRFGADFSQVRVHTDSEAVRMNQELNAQAFTHQQDVYFGTGKVPGNDALTAHELTYVVQQMNGYIQTLLQRKEENNSTLAEIQGLPMYELLPRLSNLSEDILNDEEAGRLVGGPRLVVAMQAVRAKIERNITNFLLYSKADLQALPSDQATDILSYIGAGTSVPSTSQSETKSTDIDDEGKLAQLNLELAAEIAKAAADIAGIADPTPISDGISASISLAQGDYISAGLSVVAMIPYVGDLLGKPIKAARNAAKISKLKSAIEAITKTLIKGKKSKASEEVISAGVKAVELNLPRSLSAAADIRVGSKIHKSSYAIKQAEAMSEVAQRDVDSLLKQLRQGNDNPGIGTRALSNQFFELRGRNGGRVIVKRISAGEFDIVGKFQGHVRGDKANSEIIQKLMNEYQP